MGFKGTSEAASFSEGLPCEESGIGDYEVYATLMSIQVRVRAQRVQMAEETEVIPNRRRLIRRKFPQYNINIEEPKVKLLFILRCLSKSNTYLNFWAVTLLLTILLTESDGYWRSRHLSSFEEQEWLLRSPEISEISARVHYLLLGRSPVVGSRATVRGALLAIVSTKHAQDPTSLHLQSQIYENILQFDQRDSAGAFARHYMANTESSKAKARSQSLQVTVEDAEAEQAESFNRLELPSPHRDSSGEAWFLSSKGCRSRSWESRPTVR